MLDEFNISPIEAYTLLQRSANPTLDELPASSYFWVYDCYCLSDGKILLLYLMDSDEDRPRGLYPEAAAEITDALLLPSKDVLIDLEQKILNGFESSRGANVTIDMEKNTALGEHILAGRLPQGQDFPLVVSELVQRLPALLNLDDQTFEVSLEYSELLDASLRKIGYLTCLEPPVFASLVAYAGELMKLIAGGEWHMEEHNGTGAWEPYILTPHGRKLNPWLRLDDILREGDEEPGNVVQVVVMFEINNAR